ncbi:hypothetical protein ALC60_04044 [Trachymyrmex zeteki]|uniref:Uncharacterized protein n=1 Tax=Mycetomoellerius zeteki TaxID=64791 RepID=A0A151X9J2_9HYME|nr:hypothetical protein ALC60_04044 [Trachymyrmex zeteki]
MSAQSDKNVRWSRHGPPAVHQFCPWGTRGSLSLPISMSVSLIHWIGDLMSYDCDVENNEVLYYER